MHRKEPTLETMASRCSTMLLALLLFSFAITARSTKYRNCDIVGEGCSKDDQCGYICKIFGRSSKNVLCIPDPIHKERGNVCCCLI
ncbi:hypothetical protein MUK42_21917 [Musa troglodytarum]|uniref:Defensin-like protein n=1 Tax=Musa troglodytarum TaxID=320322 RepID=A0A9E7KAH9_9LILI|nr:hypothetical protein MUK42_21917 [Musa troglodytarum]